MNSENSLVLKFLLSLQPELLIQTSFLICLSFLARSPVINTLLKISFLNFITFPLSSDVSNRAFFSLKCADFAFCPWLPTPDRVYWENLHHVGIATELPSGSHSDAWQLVGRTTEDLKTWWSKSELYLFTYYLELGVGCSPWSGY